MTELDLSRITHPLRLAVGSHAEGSGKGCAMNVVSYTNGDQKITDFPACSARPLARLVQMVNDEMARPDGLLSPEDAVVALDLGWRTVGTADVPDSVIHEWLAEMLASPVWGVIRHADKDGAIVIERIAELHRKVAKSEMNGDWSAAIRAAESAAENAADPSAAQSAAWSAAEAARSAAAEKVAEKASEPAVWSVTDAVGCSADKAAAVVEFAGHAIDAWRRIAALDPTPVDYDAIDKALTRIGGAA